MTTRPREKLFNLPPSMAAGLIKKKLNRRPLNTVKPNSNLTPPPMVSPSSRFVTTRPFIFASILLLASVVILLTISSNMWYNFTFHDPDSINIFTIQVVNRFPHDSKAFTQGLLYAGNDTLYESTGLYWQSSVRKVALQTGKVKDIQKMDGSHFGEGLTLIGERLFQVTWLKKTGFIYDKNNLSKYERFTHQMQDGWGLATDGKVLFGSDGTSMLYRIDPATLKVTGKQYVKYRGQDVHNLNELEFINNEVWANVWQSDCIARISPKDGVVRGWVLLHNLREELMAAGERHIDVLNGIAWDSEKRRIFVTGKLWPKLYEIELHPLDKRLDGTIEQVCLREPVDFVKRR